MTNNICSNCGFDKFKVARFMDKMTYRKKTYEIEYEAMQCDRCGDAFLTSKQSKEVTKKLVNMFRLDQNLLIGQELKRIRKKIDYTQADLEKLLGCGENTVIRWEKDLSSQMSYIDRDYRILDLVDEDPEFVKKIFPKIRLPKRYEEKEVHLPKWSDDITYGLEKTGKPIKNIDATPMAA